MSPRETYGKIYASIYDGTLRDHWQAMVVFQAMIIIADARDCVDLTASALAARTGYPLEVVTAGLDHLAQPDPISRSQAEDGRRIVLIDPARPWGWRIVNRKQYREIRDPDERRDYFRNYRREERAAKAGDVHPSSPLFTGVHQVSPHEVGSMNIHTEHALLVKPIASGGEVREITLAGVAYTAQSCGLAMEVLQTNRANVLVVVTERDLSDWAKLYPAVNIAQHVRNMRGWLIANPKNRKTPAGMARFVHAWLGREQNGARPAAVEHHRSRTDREYLDRNSGGAS